MYAYGLGMTLEASLLLSPGGLSDSELAAWSGLQVWLDPKYLASLTLGAAPTLSTWAGANWAGSGLGPYTHTAGSTADLTSATLISGNRYRFSWSVSGRTVGTVTKKFGTATDGGARSANGAYTDEATANAVGDTWTPTSDFDGAVTVASGSNISLTSIAPRAGALAPALTQATATLMPWVDSDDGGLQMNVDGIGTFDATVRAGVKCLHDGTGGTCVVAFKVLSTSGTQFFFDTGGVGGITPGCQLVVFAGGSAYVLLKNGSAQVGSRLLGALSVGQKYVLVATISATTLTCRINRSTSTSGYSGALSSSSSHRCSLGDANYGSGPIGVLYDTLIFNRILDSLEIARLENKLATKWGIAL